VAYKSPYSLADVGLPDDYSNLTSGGQKDARIACLTSWFDPKKPHILCTDTEAFCKADLLWQECYLKPAKVNEAIYYFDDPLCRRDMARAMMAPPKIPTEPCKTLISAPRRMGKTQTVLVGGTTLAATVRPNTGILIVEYNATRNEEEIKKIMAQMEDNDRIHADFGGRGKLFPRKSSAKKSWSSERLDLYNGSYIAGHSVNSAQRGRGPLWSILDDPEPEDLTRNKKWRAEFFQNLFGVFLPMFHFGCKITWVGTPIHLQSCLNQALKGLSEKDPETAEERDTRFDDWHRLQIMMIQEGEDGPYSIQPQRLSVEAAEHKKKTLGIQAYMAEIQGIPIQPGQFAFTPHDTFHHYMHCVDEKGEEYHFDLKTGTRTPWRTWIKSLLVMGAMDPSTGTGIDSDPGAIVLIGIAPGGVRYILDVYNRRVFPEILIDAAIQLSDQWKCNTFAVEKVAMQVIVARLMRQKCMDLLNSGKFAPRVIDLANHKKDKISRILTLTPYFTHHQLRFKRLDDFVAIDGTVHKAVPTPNRTAHLALMEQILSYTDTGIAGPDDAIDCLEMVLRTSQNSAPGMQRSQDVNPIDQTVAEWKEVGFDFNRNSIPIASWTPTMWAESAPVFDSGSADDDDGY
jgi:hypothetical protein